MTVEGIDARQVRAKQFLGGLLGGGEGGGGALEAVELAPSVESLLPANMPADADEELVIRTAEKIVRGEDLDAPETMALEAIIIPDKRPAIDIVNGDFTVAHPDWTDFAAGAAHDALRKALPSIGRIELPGHPSLPYGGTGFVVGNGLVMTNRHVAEIFADGAGRRECVFRSGAQAGIDFLREVSGGTAFLKVESVVMIHPFWDMALLKVDGLGSDHPMLQLSLEDPDAIVGRRIAVIGYPAFDPRNDAEVQNRVFNGLYNVKRLQPGLLGRRYSIESFGKKVSAATHDGSTLGGDSGAAVFDPKTGAVLALHFGGIYMLRNYGVAGCDLAQDGRVIDAGVQFAGTPRRKSGVWDRYWLPDEGVVPPAAAPADPADTPPPASVPASGPESHIVRFMLPIEVSVSVGTPQPVAAIPDGAAGPLQESVMPVHDGPEIPRSGYNQDFLGIPVPLPSALDLDVVAKLEDGGYVIPYHHFSLVMHKLRRLALFTAANVDASPARKQPEAGYSYTRKALSGIGEGSERWFNDPRLRGTDQLPDRFFDKDNKAFDKGHLVRRDDVAWGDSFAELRAANGDTYHVTNCSPQVAGFNRSNHDDNWGALEDVVLKQAKLERYCLFSGPVLADDDPTFAGVDDLGVARVQIPREFWKVVVARDGDRLQAFAFLLTQNLSSTPLEFVVSDAWVKRMIPIAELERKLRLVRFAPAVRKADQYKRLSGGAED
jgi:endonuclease G